MMLVMFVSVSLHANANDCIAATPHATQARSSPGDQRRTPCPITGFARMNEKSAALGKRVGNQSGVGSQHLS